MRGMRRVVVLVVAVSGLACASPRAPEPGAPRASRADAPVVDGDILPPRGWLVPGDVATFAGAAPPYRARVPAAVEEFALAERPRGCAEVRWSVDGPAAEPARGVGERFRVTFSAPGTYVVRARCGDVVAERTYALCDWRSLLEVAAAYFGASTDFSRVTVDFEGTLTGASWARHNHVSIGDAVLDLSDGCPDASHLVHEFGHVWEHQHGQAQLTRGALDQFMNLYVDVYDYGGAEGVRRAVAEGRPLESFNLEQQAEIFAHDFAFKRAGDIDHTYARDLDALTRPALSRPPVVR